MRYYRASLNSVPGDDFTQTITAGTSTFSFHFRWDTANQEQYDILNRALLARAAADPLIKDSEIIREYSWIDWYSTLPDTAEKIIPLLEEGMEYPQSLRRLKDEPTLLANQLLERREEALSLNTTITPLCDQLVWNVDITDEQGNIQVGVVRPGGWINNQSSAWSIQFVCDRARLGRDDLALVTIRMEIAE